MVGARAGNRLDRDVVGAGGGGLAEGELARERVEAVVALQREVFVVKVGRFVEDSLCLEGKGKTGLVGVTGP